MEEKITANEFYNEDLTPLQNMIEFAKIHVGLALVKAKNKCDDMTNTESLGDYVLNSYPDSNIK